MTKHKSYPARDHDKLETINPQERAKQAKNRKAVMAMKLPKSKTAHEAIIFTHVVLKGVSR